MDRAIVVFEVSGYTAALAADFVHWVLPLKQGDVGPRRVTMFGRHLTPVRLECLLEMPTREFRTDSGLIFLKDLSMGVIALHVGPLVELLFIAVDSLIPVEQDDFMNGCVGGVVLSQGRKIHLLSNLRLIEEHERLQLGFTTFSYTRRFAIR